MRQPVLTAVVSFLLACPAAAADPKPNALTEKEIADGWLLLFDGESTFGWTVVDKNNNKPALAAKDGTLVFSGQDSSLELTARFRRFELLGEYTLGDHPAAIDLQPAGAKAGFQFSGTLTPKTEQWKPFCVRFDATLVDVSVDGKSQFSSPGEITADFDSCRLGFSLSDKGAGTLRLRNLKVRPLGGARLFDGKTLAGWKVNAADPKRAASKFDVTDQGELRVTNGPGDLHTEKAFADFVLQFECKTNGDALNSGIFFRCVPDQYQNGYEAQIQNAFQDGDRTKPADFGTGAIYRRVPARKVVSNDKEWFAMTVIAHGAHVATWVNGYQVVDWTDDRKPDDNPRKGLRTAAGHLSIQGHDPTTDILFRNIRVAELKAAK